MWKIIHYTNFMENGRGEGGDSEFYNPDQWWPQGNSDSLGMSRELPILQREQSC